MSALAERAKSTWLLSFADVVTLLITFFIMMLALHHTEISRVQKWAEQQVEQSYQFVQAEFQREPFEYIEVLRNGRGIHFSISHPQAFERGGYQVSAGLEVELSRLARLISALPLFHLQQDAQARRFIQKAQQDGVDWRAEVVVEGHSDNDPIDPRSPLRNNWFLSTMRAQNVMQLLYVNSRLQNQTFSVAGFGEFRPVASNDTEAGKAQNRRVDVVVNASFIRQTSFELGD